MLCLLIRSGSCIANPSLRILAISDLCCIPAVRIGSLLVTTLRHDSPMMQRDGTRPIRVVSCCVYATCDHSVNEHRTRLVPVFETSEGQTSPPIKPHVISLPLYTKAYTPLIRFVVDLLWTCWRLSICCTTSRDVVDLSYSLLYNKSTTNRISGV